MAFRDLQLSRKLAVGFGAVLLVLSVAGVATCIKLRQVAEVERINASSDAVIDAIDRGVASLNGSMANVRRFAITGDLGDKAKVQEAKASMTNALTEAKGILQQDGPEYLPDLANYQEKVNDLFAKTIDVEAELASDPATRPQALALIGSPVSAPYAVAMDEAQKSLDAKIRKWCDGWTEAGNKAMDDIQWLTISASLVSILIGIAMAWLIVRAVARPVSEIVAAMRSLAGGNVTVEIPALGRGDEIGQIAAAVQTFKEAAIAKLDLERHSEDSRRTADADRGRSESERAQAAREQASVVEALASGLEHLSEGQLLFRIDQSFAPEYEKLRADFNEAMAKLQETMKTVSGNTTAIRSGTDEISSAADDLSRRTEQQAASLEETAAALDEITATVRKTAEGARHAREVVGTAKTDAEHSAQVVRQAVGAMEAIAKSSGQIGQIIGVIDEIAFQTNLLALNAGVEAARAGDAGRGFAVVASEVRALAQRSAEAAKEIKSLISASSTQVEQGVHLVDETGQALERIFVQVSEINGIVTDIAASTQEQSTALHEVNTAVNQMDQVTQQNAAMVEESTAASHALAQETEELARLIGRFDVGASPSPGAARRGGGRSAPAPKPAFKPKTVSAMKTTGSGGAARKPEAVEDWKEF